MKIILDHHEMKYAEYVGKNRNKFAIDNNYTHHHQDLNLTLKHQIIGASAEYAVAKALNIHWDHQIGSIKKADLGNDIQIRCTENPRGRLMIRLKDNADHRYIFVIKTGLEFEIQGWLFGFEGKRKEWYESPTDKGFDYFVPNTALKSMNDLIEIKRNI